MICKVSAKIADLGQKAVKKITQNPLKMPNFKKPLLKDEFVKGVKPNVSFDAFLDVFEESQIREASLYYSPIKFTPATTLKEAHKTAKKLGIKHYRLGENNTLEVWNYLNEGFTRYKNAHLGLDFIPKKIYFKSDKSTTRMAANKYTSSFYIYECFYGINKISNAIQKKINDVILDFCDETPEGIKIPKFFAPEDEINYAQNLIRKFQNNPQSLNYGDKIELLTILNTMHEVIETFVYQPKLLAHRLFANDDFMAKCHQEKKLEYLHEILNSKNNTEALEKMGKILSKENETLRVQLSNKKYTTMFHEMGHLQDCLVERAPACVQFASQNDYPAELKEWLNDSEYQRISYLVSNYATCGPGEFIAETYAKLLSGDVVPKEAVKLYKQMRGPKIPYII